jgi:hypothetical protein
MEGKRHGHDRERHGMCELAVTCQLRRMEMGIEVSDFYLFISTLYNNAVSLLQYTAPKNELINLLQP